ncbi:hypothetical protein ACS0TY_018934 [Phlomoides rotata]
MQSLLAFLIFLSHLLSFSCSQNYYNFNQQKNYEGSSNLVDLKYHMGPVLASPINLYIIWYGHWNPNHQSTIRDFIYSVSSPAPFPSVADWWRTLRRYSDQTGANVTAELKLSGEFHDRRYSHGGTLTRLSIQSIIKNAVTASRFHRSLPLNYRTGLYLVLTSRDVQMEEFCRAICGFHYFTFPSIVGVTMPYAWIGYSGKQCPGMCAFPFAFPGGNQPAPATAGVVGPPNGDVGTDGMISVIAHELAEVSSNPLINAWYAGEDPTAPTEIADLCLGLYGSGGGGGYMGAVGKDSYGNGYNLNGVKGRKYLVQWVWDPVRRRCFGPNALD